MTTPRLIFLAVVALLWLTPAPGVAQAPAQPEAGGASVLRVDDVADQIIRVTTRIRHTTVIQLPAHETILDFVVGDSEYWHLSGAANLAFLKPIGERVTTNVALVCESGRIYSFLVTERAAPPHLVVRIGADGDVQPAGGGGHIPAFVSRESRGRVSADGRAEPADGDCGADRGRGTDRGGAPRGDRARGHLFARPIPRSCSFPMSWTRRRRAGRSS